MAKFSLKDTDPMPFGKYKGTPMQDVPARYFLWLWTEVGYNFGVRRGMQGEVAEYIDQNIDALKQEYPDGIWPTATPPRGGE